MNLIKSNWKSITLLLIVGCYIVFVFIMDKRTDLFTPAILIYFIITTILFLNSVVGAPGIIIHSVFKKEGPAIPFYKAAIRLGSTNTNILAAYGLILLRDNQPTDAKKLFKTAIENSRHYMYNKTLTANIALCEWKEGNVPKATKTYEDLYYYPDLEELTNFSEGNLQEGIDKNHNFYAQDFTTMAFLMHLNNEKEKAIYFSLVSLEKSGKYGPAFDNLGQIHYQDGDIIKAKEFFQKALEYNPTMSDSLYYLAKIALDEENNELSKKYLNQIDLDRINGLSTITKETVNNLING